MMNLGSGKLSTALSNLTGAPRFLASMLSEGIEESTQAILQPLFLSIASGGKINYDVNWGEVAKSGIYGMITAGIINGSITIVNGVLTSKNGTIIGNIDDIPSNKEFEVINVADLDMTIERMNKYAINPNQSYEGYDYVVRADSKSFPIVSKIIANSLEGNILIEIPNIIDLSLTSLENIPDNINVRVSDYNMDYWHAYRKSPQGSTLGTLAHVTYNIAELKTIMTEINNIESNINPNWNSYEIAEYVYEYLKNNIEYDANPTGIYFRHKQYDGLTNLITKKSTCQGFANTYCELLTRLGIEVAEVWGSLDGEGQHAYNIVTIDGKSFIVDTVREALEKNAIANGNTGMYAGTGFGVENVGQYTARCNQDLLSRVTPIINDN